jgi:putative phage-type endonuclease
MSAIAQSAPEWEAYRQSLKGIGASQAAAALGIDPRRTAFDLWSELTGRTVRPEANARMKRGKRLEPVAREWLAEEKGWRIEEVADTLRDGRWPDLFAHLDGRLADDPTHLVEIKTRWSDFDGDVVPLEIQAQVQQQMALAGASLCTVTVMTFDDLHPHDVPFDPDTALPMLDKLEAWYQRHVVGDEPPRDDSEGYMRWLGRELAEGPARDATFAELSLIQQVVDARKRKDDAERDEAEYKARLMESMVGCSELLGAGFSLTWKRTKDRVHVDWPSIAKAYRTLIDRALEKDPDALGLGLDPWNAVLAIESIHTNTEPGTRPFRLVTKE